MKSKEGFLRETREKPGKQRNQGNASAEIAAEERCRWLIGQIVMEAQSLPRSALLPLADAQSNSVIPETEVLTQSVYLATAIRILSMCAHLNLWTHTLPPSERISLFDTAPMGSVFGAYLLAQTIFERAMTS
jgi:hypothetical protein